MSRHARSKRIGLAVAAAALALGSLLGGCERETKRVYVPIEPRRLAWTVQHPPLGLSFYSGVSGASPRGIFAVGDRFAAHFDGARWSRIQGVTSYLTDVAAVSDSEAYAVGESGRLLHLTASACTVTRTFDESIGCIWASGPSDVWVMGSTHAFRFDGTAWNSFALPVPAFSCASLWGSSSDNMYAAGWPRSNAVLHYDGTSWDIVEGLPHNSSLATAVWGSGADDVWIAGTSDTLSHFDGARWNIVVNGGGAGPQDVYAISGASRDDVYFAGAGLWHYDGTAFTRIDLPRDYGRSTITGVWAAPGLLVCVGGMPTILTYDGSSWTDAQGRYFPPLLDVWSDSPHNAWAVGDRGLMLHYDGVRWVDESDTTLTRYAINAISGTGKSLYAVGEDRAILHYDGDAWRRIEITDPAYLGWFGDVWASRDEAFAVGGTRVAHIRGMSATFEIAPTGHSLHAIWGSSPADVYAVGADGTILHYDGSAWTVMASPDTMSDWYDVWGTGPRNVYACGSRRGCIYRYDGISWRIMWLGTTYTYRTIWATSASDIFCLSGGAYISHFDGTRWTTSAVSSDNVQIQGIGGSAPDNVFAVCYFGAVLHYGP